MQQFAKNLNIPIYRGDYTQKLKELSQIHFFSLNADYCNGKEPLHVPSLLDGTNKCCRLISYN